MGVQVPSFAPKIGKLLSKLADFFLQCSPKGSIAIRFADEFCFYANCSFSLITLFTAEGKMYQELISGLL